MMGSFNVDFALKNTRTVDVSQSYTLGSFSTFISKSLNLTSITSKIRLRNLDGAVAVGLIVDIVQNAIDSLLDKAIREHNITTPKDEIRYCVYLKHPTMNVLSKNGVYLAPRSRLQNTAQALFAECQRVMQSAEGIQLDQDLSLTVTLRPETSRGGVNEEDNLCLLDAVEQSVAAVNVQMVKDRLVGKHKYRTLPYKKANEFLDRINNDREYMRGQAIKRGYEHISGFDHTEGRLMDLDDVAQLGRGCNGVRLAVYDYHTGAQLFIEANKIGDPIAPILYDATNQHYTKMPPMRDHFDGTVRPQLKHMCKLCGVLAGAVDYHLNCPHKCRNCQNHHGDCVMMPYEEKSCLTCHLNFRNDQCFANHLKKGKCLAQRYNCLGCSKLFFSRAMPETEHKCGQEKYCGKCGTYCSLKHVCGWAPFTEDQREKAFKKTEKFKFIFYDLEMSPNTIENGEIKWRDRHIVTQAVAHMVCNVCCEDRFWPTNVVRPANQNSCACIEGPIVFSSTSFEKHDVIDRFGEWLFFTPAVTNGYTVIAHNGSRFDSHFLLDYLLRNKATPRTICNGQSILCMKTKRTRRDGPVSAVASVWNITEPPEQRVQRISELRIIDSCNFIPIPLAKFASTFGLQESKGHFPIFANTPDFVNNTQWPGLQFFNADNKKGKERDDIISFLNEMNESGTPFNMEEEIIKYCTQDVKVLMEGVLMCRKMFVETGKHDPFVGDLTLASACLSIFRTFHNSEFICSLPERGYRQNERYSELGIKYLEWLAREEGLQIRHAENGGEHAVDFRDGTRARLDGHYVDDTGQNVAVEVNGCFYHGCTVCKRADDRNPMNDKTFGELHEMTRRRGAKLEAAGFRVRSIWEHEIHDQCRVNKEMGKFFKTFQCRGVLEPRKAFKGGRTQSFRTFVEPEEGQQLYYYDVTSLYPFVCSTSEYPLGKPRVIYAPSTAEACTVRKKSVCRYVNGECVRETKIVQNLNHRGLYFCKVLPPIDLFIALLPYRHSNYLFYPLCRRCTEIKCEGDNIGNFVCDHTDDERALTDIWYGEELQMALDRGYKLVETYEIWAWRQFSKGTVGDGKMVGGLFSSYMNTFFRCKQEASGFPSRNMSEEEKQAFMTNFKEKHGVELCREKMENPCKEKRFIAKMSLNSLWGRMGLKTERTSVTFCRTRQEVDAIWYSPTTEIVGDQALADGDVWMFRTKECKEVQHSVDYGSLAVAIVTTSRARIILTHLLMELGEERVCYCDTDSVMFTGGTRESDPVLAGFLRRHAGSDLGKLTNEIPEGYEGVKLIAPGAKQYALRVKYTGTDPSMPPFIETVKLRGISQNFSTQSLIDMDVLEAQTMALVMGRQELQEPVRVAFSRIKKNLGQISSVDMIKQYLARNCKGIHKDFMVFPYGYKQ